MVRRYPPLQLLRTKQVSWKEVTNVHNKAVVDAAVFLHFQFSVSMNSVTSYIVPVSYAQEGVSVNTKSDLVYTA